MRTPCGQGGRKHRNLIASNVGRGSISETKKCYLKSASRAGIRVAHQGFICSRSTGREPLVVRCLWKTRSQTTMTPLHLPALRYDSIASTYDGVGHNMPDIDCYKAGYDGAGKCPSENVKQGSGKGNKTTSMRPVKTRKNSTTRKDRKLTHRHGQQKRHTRCGTKTTERTIFSLEAAEPRGWTISKNLRSLIPKATEEMQKRYQNKNPTENSARKNGHDDKLAHESSPILNFHLTPTPTARSCKPERDKSGRSTTPLLPLPSGTIQPPSWSTRQRSE